TKNIHHLYRNLAPPRRTFTKYALKNRGLLLTLKGNPQGPNVDPLPFSASSSIAGCVLRTKKHSILSITGVIHAFDDMYTGGGCIECTLQGFLPSE
ncbi:MAG: hypothetical protein K8R16_07625, partial [Anaerolineales bacterium]|nr:hypothetical protein [Anaerolineales bacterium]